LRLLRQSGKGKNNDWQEQFSHRQNILDAAVRNATQYSRR
jgi:hypothetical protein